MNISFGNKVDEVLIEAERLNLKFMKNRIEDKNNDSLFYGVIFLGFISLKIHENYFIKIFAELGLVGLVGLVSLVSLVSLVVLVSMIFKFDLKKLDNKLIGNMLMNLRPSDELIRLKVAIAFSHFMFFLFFGLVLNFFKGCDGHGLMYAIFFLFSLTAYFLHIDGFDYFKIRSSHAYTGELKDFMKRKGFFSEDTLILLSEELRRVEEHEMIIIKIFYPVSLTIFAFCFGLFGLSQLEYKEIIFMILVSCFTGWIIFSTFLLGRFKNRSFSFCYTAINSIKFDLNNKKEEKSSEN